MESGSSWPSPLVRSWSALGWPPEVRPPAAAGARERRGAACRAADSRESRESRESRGNRGIPRARDPAEAPRSAAARPRRRRRRRRLPAEGLRPRQDPHRGSARGGRRTGLRLHDPRRCPRGRAAPDVARGRQEDAARPDRAAARTTSCFGQIDDTLLIAEGRGARRRGPRGRSRRPAAQRATGRATRRRRRRRPSATWSTPTRPAPAPCGRSSGSSPRGRRDTTSASASPTGPRGWRRPGDPAARETPGDLRAASRAHSSGAAFQYPNMVLLLLRKMKRALPQNPSGLADPDAKDRAERTRSSSASRTHYFLASYYRDASRDATRPC